MARRQRPTLEQLEGRTLLSFHHTLMYDEPENPPLAIQIEPFNRRLPDTAGGPGPDRPEPSDGSFDVDTTGIDACDPGDPGPAIEEGPIVAKVTSANLVRGQVLLGQEGSGTVYLNAGVHLEGSGTQTNGITLVVLSAPAWNEQFPREVQGRTVTVENPWTDQPLSNEIALEYAEGIVRAVGGHDHPPVTDSPDHAHQATVLHNVELVDLEFKPSNVFLQWESDVMIKIVDFGLASTNGNPPTTQAWQVGGTPGYMSPEMAVNIRIDSQNLSGVSHLIFNGVDRITTQGRPLTVAASGHWFSSLNPEVVARLRPVPGLLVGNDPADARLSIGRNDIRGAGRRSVVDRGDLGCAGRSLLDMTLDRHVTPTLEPISPRATGETLGLAINRRSQTRQSGTSHSLDHSHGRSQGWLPVRRAA